MNREFYEKNGYWIEENVFSEAECRQLIETSKTLENYANGSYRPMMMPHRVNDLYLKALSHPRIVATIARMVGGKPAGLQTEFFYCRPGTRGFSLHQDNFFVEAPPGAFVSAWCALTDTHEENGGLIVYPGTHMAGLLPTRKLAMQEDAGQDPNANKEEAVVPPEYTPLNVSVPKGAAIYIHGHLVHGSNANRSGQWRYVLLNTYIREGETFRSGRYARREAIALLQAS